MTQRALASRIGIDFTYLSKLENDRGDPPSEVTIRKFAEELGTDPDGLLALAGKIPVELRERAAEDPDFALFLRRLPNLSRDDLRDLYRRADIPKPDPPRSEP